MNRNIPWGVGALVAVAAVLGISTQSFRSSGSGVTAVGEAKKGGSAQSYSQYLAFSVCADPEKLLQGFVLTDENKVAAPDSCYLPAVLLDPIAKKQVDQAREQMREKTSHLSFVIATLPDPLHTHLSLLFDRKIEAIQGAAQDAGYDYDSSWLPWQTEERTFPHLGDQDAIDARKDAREEQPGLILFRRRSDKLHHLPESGQEVFQEGLVVFVVGEEATRGIHRRQFQNAAAWIAILQPDVGTSLPSAAILGPTFSGSFSSLAELLSDEGVRNALNYEGVSHLPDRQLRIYSGSVSGKEAAETFGALSVTDPNLNGWNIHFHSFIEDDDSILDDYCGYIAKNKLELKRVALISEDETAYGIGGIRKESGAGRHGDDGREEHGDKGDTSDSTIPCPRALRLFYPRDIAALRAAYQAQSIFSAPSYQQSGDAQRRTLSTDLADPSGEAHDTVRSYGGNQAPLAQEAQLLAIVGVLQDHRSEYLVIRSSNTLDQLFLANFFHRAYPQGRIVIRGADTLFLREPDSGGISGVIMLSTYPLIPWDWREWPNSRSPTHRVFGEETVEGTYIATRFLIQEAFRRNELPTPLGDDWPVCSVEHPERCFVPPNLNQVPIELDGAAPHFYHAWTIPDYKAPFWAAEKSCQSADEKFPHDKTCEPYFRPATWISVLGRGNFYPIIAFSRKTQANTPEGPNYTEKPKSPIIELSSDADTNTFDRTPGRFSIPLGMKICLLAILAFGAFHIWCCWFASFTAKPAFRAHFAATKNWFHYGSWQHPTLITMAGVLLAFIALATAQGCGGFCIAGLPLAHQLWVRLFLAIALLGSVGSLIANHQATYRLETFSPDRRGLRWYFALNWGSKPLRWSLAGFLIAIAVFGGAFIYPFESVLTFQNRVPTYWRAMNLNSGVSPIVPFLVLFAGLYVWFRHALHGLALFGIERPQLPSNDCLVLKDEDGSVAKNHTGKPVQNFRMFSQERAEDTEKVAIPMECHTLVFAGVVFLVILIVSVATARWMPLRSLGADVYGLVFFVLLDVCIGWVLAEAWQLWRGLKELLSFLDRIPLRRTMSALQGFSWGNVWRMSGNVLDVRDKLLSRQLETLNHVKASFDRFEKTAHGPDQWKEYRRLANCHDEVTNAQVAIKRFAPVYSRNYDKDDFANFKRLWMFQKRMAALVGKLVTDVLVPAWRAETRSLMEEEAKNSNGTDAGAKELSHVPEHIRNSEELVCITYLGFVQNILGRIRTMTLGIVWLFLAITLSVSMYPFDPRPTLNKMLIFLFVALGVIISLAYAAIHRDSTLSHVTNTTPGELGLEFWFKIISFGIGPLIGLLAYVFPGLTGFLFSWLEPGLASLK